MANSLTSFGTAFEPARLISAGRDSPLSRLQLNPDSAHPSRTGTPDSSRSQRPKLMEVPSAGPPPPPHDRPLNVTDALSYLDDVKIRFQEQPEVYNHFLDIMKDFKSEQIDTPGVIDRVSVLFHGTPYLIQGFNTFLPMGYRIDVSSNPHDNTITVTTPMGITTQSTGLGGISRSAVVHNGNSNAFPSLPPLGSAPISRSHTPHGYQSHTHTPAPQLPPFDVAFSSPGLQNPNPQTTAAASFLGNLQSNKPQQPGQPNVEFNHAIQYLNKIKARYTDDNNTYKQFLEILQTYQKDQKHLHNSQVYVQVQMLFRDDPDLLNEFKDFLPDIGFLQNGAVILPSSGSGWPGTPLPLPELDKSPKKSTVPLKRKKKPEKEPTPVPTPKLAASRAKKPKHTHKPDPEESPRFSPYLDPQSPVLSHIQPLPPHNGNDIPLVINPSSQNSPGRFSFFDRARKSLEGRETYDDFLKLLHLFAKDIIEMDSLVEQARAFLGDGELMGEFKELIGWRDKQERIDTGPPGSIRTAAPEALSALPTDDGQGPSYRRLAESEVRLACSGRDQLARSVLNDHWVSHPTWASEEAGFISHKKNTFEDALHKSEEERHEYHVHIQGLTRTIAVLEPLCARLEDMSVDDRASYRLQADFGGSAKSIYHRVIKKVYGRDHGVEIINALQDSPSIAVPVVLARLKQKDEEWRRAQREWSRTWRDVDARNFWKSLDHQGISFKANDKKNITAKYFVGDIEGVKAEQEQAIHADGVRRGKSVGHQLEYTFADTGVLYDALKLVFSFLDRSHTQYSPHERRTVEKFLRAFMPLLFMYPTADFNAACGSLETSGYDDENPLETSAAANGDHGTSRTTNGRRTASSASSSGDVRKHARKDLRSRDVSPVVQDDAVDDVWITIVAQQTTGDDLSAVYPPRQPFFANSTFYTLLRLLQVLYSRLLMCKEIGLELELTQHASLLANPVAVELGLDDPSGPPAVLAQAREDLSKSNNGNLVYAFLLDACERVFEASLDQPTFEEYMRWFFGTKAFHLFTIDKLIVALVKQVQTIIVDGKCQELFSLFQNARSSDTTTNHAIIRYRREAEQHVGLDEHLYSIEWLPSTHALRVRLMAETDPSVDGEDAFTEYADSFCLTSRTEHVRRREPSRVFLRRNLPAGDTPPTVRAQQEGMLEIHLVKGTYRMVFGTGTEEVLHCAARDPVLVERARRRWGL